MEDNFDELDEFWLSFPEVKNVQPRLLGDDIQSMTAEEVRENMGKMFDRFSELTGYEVVVKTNGGLPIEALIPEKYRENE